MYPGVFSFKGSLLISVFLNDLFRIVSGHHSVPELYREDLIKEKKVCVDSFIKVKKDEIAKIVSGVD